MSAAVVTAEGDLAHLLPEVRRGAALGDDERIALVRGERWIDHPGTALVLSLLGEVAEQPPRGRMENLLVLGESGMGKTTLLRKFERNHARPFDRVAGVEPRSVVAMRMPHEPTEGAFVAQLLTALHAPSTALAPRLPWVRRETAFRLLREVGARVLVIDEINSLLVGTARQQRLFLQLLRFLSNELSVALVCAGVPEARHALLSDPQLRGRFADVELEPWTPDADLQRFVNRLVASLPLRRPSAVDSPRIRRLLAERAGGITLNLTKAVERAAIAAIRSGRECLDLAGLEDAAVWHGLARPRPPLGRRRPEARVGG